VAFEGKTDVSLSVAVVRPHPLTELLERLACDAPCFVGISDPDVQPAFVNALAAGWLGRPTTQISPPTSSFRRRRWKVSARCGARFGVRVDRPTEVSVIVPATRPHPLTELLERVALDAPCFVGIFDPDFQPVFLNAYGRRMVGLSDGEDVAIFSLADFFAPDVREEIRDLVLPTLLREGACEGEYRFHHFGGGKGAKVKWNAFLLRDGAGELIGASCFTTDLTQRLDIEARLIESRAQLRAAVELVGLSSYMWNPQTGALQWDEGLKALWGLPADTEPDELLWMQGIHPDDRARVQAATDRAIDPDGDGTYAIEYRVVGLQGASKRWISTLGQTQFEGRKPVSFTGAVLDITSQKQAEARLRETEERFRRFAENSSDVIWILEAKQRRLEYLSPGFLLTWGVPPDQALRDIEVWRDCIHPEDRAVWAQTLEYVSAQAEAVTHEYRIVRPGGSVRWIRDTTFPIRNAEGRMTQLGGIAHDISRREAVSVYVVEPDLREREIKGALLRGAGQRVTTFASESAFLDVAAALTCGCVLVRTDDTSPEPFSLGRALKARRINLPVIFESVLGSDVELAIAAMKTGAADVLQAPADPGAMLAAVACAMANVREQEREEREAVIARTQIALMSQREREVLDGLLGGGTNKTIARELGISPRTVEIHRARVMERLGAHTGPEAVMAAASAGLKPLRRNSGGG
jgi:PAS domain S-box-containing protein